MKKKNMSIHTVGNLFKFSCFIILPYLFFCCKDNEGPATLTTINNSSAVLERVTWRGTSFGNLSPGDTVTESVQGIDDAEPYDFYKEGTEYFTKENVLVKRGTGVKFIFTNSTVIVTYK